MRASLGRGRACDSLPICAEQGFDGDAWYYEMGVATSDDIRQLPLLVVVYDPKGRVARTWTLTTH